MQRVERVRDASARRFRAASSGTPDAADTTAYQEA